MPPAIESMDSQIHNPKGGEDTFDGILLTPVNCRSVTVHLSDINFSESLPDRIITLEHPTWSIDIGRGSCSDDNIVPEADNAWFTSKVMSRQHATIKAHPESMILTIKDTSSMHGTFLNGDRITGDAVELLPNDIITFGTDVIRHSESFTPLKTKIVYEWHEKEQPRGRKNKDYTNTFTADYSEEDVYSDLDDEVEIVHDSVRQPSVEIIEQRAVSITNSPSLASDCIRRSSTSLPTSSLSDPMDAMEPKEKSEIKTKFVDVFDNSSESEDDYPDHQSEDESLDSPIPPPSIDIPDDSVIDIDDDEDEDEDIISETAPEVYIDDQSTANKAKAARQPSPSDAAMAKPHATLTPKAQLLKTAVSPPPSNTTPFAFATAPSPPPPMPMGSTLSMCNMFEGPRIWNWNDSMSSGVPPTTTRGPFGYDISHTNPYPIAPSYPPEPSHAPLPHMEQLPTLPPPSFLNPSPSGMYWPGLTQPPPPLPLTKNGFTRSLKRKAADISSNQDSALSVDKHYGETDTHLDKGPDTSVSGKVDQTTVYPQNNDDKATKTPNNQLVSQSEPQIQQDDEVAEKVVPENTTNILREANIVVEPIEEEVREPPEKKVRIQEPVAAVAQTPSLVRTAAKYAATALAGASVGAVGVVLGLASLPPNYFA